MEKKEILEAKGYVSVVPDNQEATLIVYEENDGFIDEKEYDILKLLEDFDGKLVRLIVEHSRRGDV